MATAQEAWLSGALLMAGLIMGFGPQNVFVLRTGLSASHSWLVPTVCSVCDALLIVAGVACAASLGTTLGASDLRVLSQAGAVLLVIFAARALLSASKPDPSEPGGSPVAAGATASKRSLLLWSLGFSLLNPWVYLDSVLLVGLNALSLPSAQRPYYAAGASTASTLWYFGLTYGARAFRAILSGALAARVLDAIAAALCLSAAWNLWWLA
jgi:L-lysine exporter family protein LysE/ArgO